MNEFTQWAREFFKDDLFATQATGIFIEQADKNYSLCRFDVLPHHLNAKGFVMGGAIYTLADFAFAVAANAGNNLTVSLNANINYLRPASGKELFAEANCIKNGKTTCVFNVKITDENKKEVAVATVTGFRS